MSDELQFKAGDRVRVKASKTQYFVQPWRGRFERGVEGTVTSFRPCGLNRWQYFIQFHSKRKPKRESDWKIALPARDIEHVKGSTNER